MEHHMTQYSQYPQQGMGGIGQASGMAQGQQGMAQGMGAMSHGQSAQSMGYYGQPMYNPYYQQQNSSLFNDRFLKGLLIGAAAAYLLTNESVQRTAIKGAVKAWSLLQGGVEELKERFHDAEAEIRSESGE
jgi:hypothetical protein